MHVIIMKTTGETTEEIVHKFLDVTEVIKVNEVVVEMKIGLDLYVWPLLDDQFVRVQNYFTA